MKRINGFTLVELLITIVLIAILASISTVAYGGVQSRAHSVAAATARSSYVKLLKLYHVENGTYPLYTGAGSETVCLGRASDYPARDGFAAGQCRYSDYTSATASTNSAVIAALDSYGSWPSLNWPPATEYYTGYGTDYYRGIFYSPSADGSSAYVWFFLKGNSFCPKDGYGGYNSETGETQCTIRI